MTAVKKLPRQKRNMAEGNMNLVYFSFLDKNLLILKDIEILYKIFFTVNYFQFRNRKDTRTINGWGWNVFNRHNMQTITSHMLILLICLASVWNRSAQFGHRAARHKKKRLTHTQNNTTDTKVDMLGQQADAFRELWRGQAVILNQ